MTAVTEPVPAAMSGTLAEPIESQKPPRLTSLDAYRGFIMLAMVSGGFAFSRLAQDERVLNEWSGTAFDSAWRNLWQFLAYQFSHVEWTGCGFWDLIQPSFMFMVGVSMPYSYGRRSAEGQSRGSQLVHVLTRSLILVLLGLFLKDTWNVLTQIGLGYTFAYLFLGRTRAVQLTGLAVILGGYWYYFYQYEVPPAERELIVAYLAEVVLEDATPEEVQAEWKKFDGLPSHWNKHVNAAAAADRAVLNLAPLGGEPFPPDPEAPLRYRFWVNRGGYQTLNFIPSIATILFGLMAGEMLRSSRNESEKLRWLLKAGALCFLTSMAIDTTIWPVQIAGLEWSLCPIVKRIWTPSWAVFSAGWTFWMLALFYWVIDIRGYRKWAFPLVVVGMNSIAMYVMAMLMVDWVSGVLEKYVGLVDRVLGLSRGLSYALFSESYGYSPFWHSVAVLFALWLICLWMYRQRIFVRI